MHFIQSITAPSGAIARFDFTNIPQTFTHLQLRVYGSSTLSAGNDNLAMYFNNDTGNNYSTNYISGSGSGVGSGQFANNPRFYIPSLFSAATSNQPSTAIIDVLDYSNPNKNKTIRIITGWDANGSGSVATISNLWMSTAAINRFTGDTSGNIAQHSRFDLYGITTNPIATGA
jgi:hypothetical protein